MGRLRVDLLGGFSVRLASGEACVLPTRKARALVAYLAVPAGRFHSREKLTALLWGDTPEVQAKHSFRQALLMVRRGLGDGNPPILLTKEDAVALDPAAVTVDVAAFESALAASGMDGLERAAGLYKGDLLDGFGVDEAPFEEWRVVERERLRELALEGLAKLLREQSRAERREEAIQTALRMLAMDPLQESVHRALMRLLVRQGRRAAALQQYQVCVASLQRELGAEPEEETRDLYQEIVQHREAAPLTEARREPARKPPSSARPESITAETPLIGRAGELATLRNAWTEAEEGRGRIVAIIGEAGVGKTRLLADVATDARERGSHVLFGRSYESAQILPFGPWVDAFRTGGLIAEETMLSGLNPVWRAELVRLFPELAGPGLPAPSDNYLRLFESVAFLVAHVASMQPLALMLEDLHWADEMSLRLLSFLGRRVHAWPVLIVVTAREEEIVDAEALRRALAELRDEGHAAELVLSPLSRDDTSSLVRHLTAASRDAHARARLEEQAWAVSEGNPFVVVETVRALREGLALRGPANSTVPQRVRELIAGRVVRLNDRARQLLSVAAVIGREFDFALLQRASGLADRDAAASVEELVRRRMLQGVDEGFDFTHDRIREVVYAGLLPPRRKLLHGDVAAALEALTAGALDPPAAALGMHYRHAEVWDKAVVYLRRAGLTAAARSALPDARVWFEQALGALEALPESRATLEQAVDLRLELRPVLYQGRALVRQREVLLEAEALAEKLNDDRRRGRVSAFITNVRTQFGQLDEAHASGTRAVAIARELGDLELQILSTTFFAQLLHYRGEYERVVDLMRGNVADLPADWVYKDFGFGSPPSVYGRYWLVRSLAHLGRFTEAAEYEAEGIRLAEPTHHSYTIALAHLAASEHRLLRGDWAKARALAEHAVAALRARGVTILLGAVTGCSAWALGQLGEASEALDRLRDADPILERARSFRRTIGPLGTADGWSYYSLGRACLLIGRLDDAQRQCDLAMEISPPGYSPYALHLAAEIATHPYRFAAERGEAHYRKALELAEPRGMRPLVAHCHLGLGTLYQRTGKQQEAREHLSLATAMYRDMEMPFYLEQTRTALGRPHGR